MAKRAVLSSISQLSNTPDTVWIINRNLTLQGDDNPSEKIKIAPRCTLIFEGGSFDYNPGQNHSTKVLELEGTNTVLIAPPTQIFGSKIKAIGTWRIDRAYPQWFDAEAGQFSDEEYSKRIDSDGKEKTDYVLNPTYTHDSTDAIQKAIDMKRVGEVFLPIGRYYVSKPISMPYSINLIGEGDGRIRRTVDYDGKEYKILDGYNAAFIIPYFPKFGNTFINNFKREYNVTITDKDGNKTTERLSLPLPVLMINILEPDSISTTKQTKADAQAELDNWEYRWTWSTSYCRMVGSVDNIYFYNQLHKTDEASYLAYNKALANLQCCLVGGGFIFQNNIWDNFRRAVRWTRDYSDGKTIVRCDVGHEFEISLLREFAKEGDNVPYAIDMGRLGDRLLVEQIHILNGKTEDMVSDEDYPNGTIYKGLKITGCQGGSVCDSILNTDCDFFDCNGMEFCDNHCEDGARIRLIRSHMSVSNNYFERGPWPNIIIDGVGADSTDATYEYSGFGSIVNITDNVFIYHNSKRNLYPRSIIGDFEIAIDTRFNAPVSMNLARNFRFVHNDTQAAQPCGISIGKIVYVNNAPNTGTLVPWTEFNNQSQLLSMDATIERNMNLRSRGIISPMPTVSFSAMNSNHIPVSTATKVSDKVTVDPSLPELNTTTIKEEFQALVIVDKDRKITSEVFPIEFEKNQKPYNGTSTSPRMGVLFGLDFQNAQTFCMIRLIRIRTTTYPFSSPDGSPATSVKRWYVDVPVCGARFLYDTSYAVDGNRWIEDNDPLGITAIDTISNFDSVEYIGENVRCFGKAKPTIGTWKKGDVIFNTGSSANKFWIFDGQNWLTR